MYHAFISYSHTSDDRLAPVLQRALERLGTVWWRRSAVRVFRDDASLATSPALWPGLEAALEKCEHFVLLASPVAAKSYWVERELDWWLAHRARDRLLIVVTGGEIAYDRLARDFDWQRSNCLPAVLKGVFDTEPHWTDLRFVTAPEHLSMRHTRFRSAALGVAAAIRGVAKDDLESTDILQHRRSVLMALGVGSAMAVLALVTAVAVWIAGQESASARNNRLESESRRLAAEALTQLDGGRGIETATLKAAIAWRLAPTEDARRALTRIDETTSDIARVLGQHTAGARMLAFSPDGRRLVTVGNEGVVLQWSLENGRSVGVPMASERQWVRQLTFSRDGSHLLLRGEREDRSTSTLSVFRVADGARLPIESSLLDPLGGTPKVLKLTQAALSPSGARVGVASANALLVIKTASGNSTEHRLAGVGSVTAMQFADESRLLFITGSHGERARIGQLEVRSGAVTFGPTARGGPGTSDFVAFSYDAGRVAIWDGHAGLALWRVDERLALSALPVPEPRPRLSELTGHHAPALDGVGRIAFGVGGLMSVWDERARRLLKSRQFKDHHGPPLALSPDGKLVAALDNGTPLVWRLDGPDNARPIEATRCAARGLEDECIQRLCERLTPPVGDERWRQVLGDGYNALVASLKDTSCTGPGAR